MRNIRILRWTNRKHIYSRRLSSALTALFAEYRSDTSPPSAPFPLPSLAPRSFPPCCPYSSHYPFPSVRSGCRSTAGICAICKSVHPACSVYQYCTRDRQDDTPCLFPFLENSFRNLLSYSLPLPLSLSLSLSLICFPFAFVCPDDFPVDPRHHSSSSISKPMVLNLRSKQYRHFISLHLRKKPGTVECLLASKHLPIMCTE